MVSSKPSGRLTRRITAVIAITAVLILLLFFPRFIERPHVQAVRHAVLQAVTIPNDKTPSNEAAGLRSILKGIAYPQGEPIRLPFLRVRDQHPGLVNFIYSITLDEKTLGTRRALLDEDALKLADTYGLLFVQILNGGDFYLNGHWVAGLARSTKEERWMWCEPFVVPLPSRFLKADGTPNVLTVSQSTLEPYIPIPRLYFGDMNQLNRVYRVVQFFGTAVGNAFKVLCLAAGLFLLGIWTVSPKERIYAVAGGASIFWAALFMILRLKQSSTDMWELWRWLSYVCEGGVISLMTLFILSLIDRTPGRWGKCAIFGLSGAAAAVDAVGGSATEYYLDLLWTPAAIVLYAYVNALLIAYWWKTRSVSAGLSVLPSVFCVVLACHDYAVQLHLIDKLSHSGLEAGWSGLFFEHILALFLGMPFLLLAASYMLLSKYRNNFIKVENSQLFLQQREIELEEIHNKHKKIVLCEATKFERERIYQDIHDGIGSQLVKAIFSLRSTQTDASTVINNLQSCLQDLRLVIDAQPESNIDVQTTVFEFCVTQEVHLEGSALEIRYDVGPESTVYADPKVNLNVLRVLQESLNNTIKHSGANLVEIKLELGKFHLTLTLTDNGHGQRSSASHVLEQPSTYGASGNRGMTGLALRAADIGAAYTVNITESGTRVRLSIPIPDDLKLAD